MTHGICHACYIASTEPRWVAEAVVKIATDTPCERHRIPLGPTHIVSTTVGTYAIVGNELVDLGVIVYQKTPRGDIARVATAHPFEVIAMNNRRDPIARSQAVADYLTARAHRELDTLLARITGGTE